MIAVVCDLEDFVGGFYEELGEIEELVKKPENLQWFRNLWEEPCANQEEFFELVHYLRPDMTFARWDEAWQWRNVLDRDFDQAVLEFVNALFGWY